MPMDITRYPKNWREISQRIREREGNCCKWCGVANGAVGARDIHGEWHDESSIGGMNADQGMALFGGEYPKLIRIVLTVAHLNHDTADNTDGNLAALCQLHHLRHDAQYHADNAKRARIRKKAEAARDAGQEAMF